MTTTKQVKSLAERLRSAGLSKCAGEVDALVAERDAFKADVEVLLGHMDTMQRCTNDPMMYNLASVVINRFAAMKGKS